MIRLGVLGSTRGTDLQAILDAIDSKLLKSKLSVVISNKKTAFILERANKQKIPSYYISHKSINRETFDKKVTDILKKYKVDLSKLSMSFDGNVLVINYKDTIIDAGKAVDLSRKGSVVGYILERGDCTGSVTILDSPDDDIETLFKLSLIHI